MCQDISERALLYSFIRFLMQIERRLVTLEFHTLSPKQIQEMRQQFVAELNRIFKKSGMSLNAIAGNTRSELHYALRGERRPSEENLRNWCYHWYNAGVITGIEASHLMNLAGYAAPAQQRQAHHATTEQRAICTSPKHVNTDELRPYKANENKNNNKIKKTILQT